MLTVAFVVVLTSVACNKNNDDESFSSEGLIYFRNGDGTYSVSGYEGVGDSVLIPAKHDGATVIGINENAFQKCAIKNVKIEDGVKEIHPDAFADCKTLESIIIPNSVEYIGRGALKSCSAVRELTVPFVGERKKLSSESESESIGWIFGETIYDDSLKVFRYYNGYEFRPYYIPLALKKVTVTGGSIKEHAFSGCKQIEEINLSNIESIGHFAFYNCENLKTISLYNITGDIGRCAFQNCACLQNIVIPNGIEKIWAAAFNGCVSLESVTLPSTIKEIGYYVFEYCPKLSKIDYIGTLEDWCKIDLGAFLDRPFYENYEISPVSLYVNGEAVAGDVVLPSGLTEIKNYSFMCCSGINSITIPSGVVSIGEGAFLGCENLQTINIPNGITSIGNAAFFYCKALQSLSIPKSVTSISQSFLECYSLSSINVDEQNERYYSQGNCLVDSTTKTLLLACNNSMISASMDINQVETYAFGSCNSLKSVDLPESVSLINWGAFLNCIGLETINLPTRLERIEQSMFNGCTSLKSITLHTARIGAHAFEGCTALETVTFSINTDGIIVIGAIGRSAFEGCSALKSVSIPEYTRTIYDSAFKDCSGLTQVEFDDELETIESYAFSGCTSLTSIAIPANVRKISDSAFADCSGLQSIVVDAQNVTYRVENNCLIQGASVMLGCKNSVIPEDGVTTIAANAFRGCAGLTHINIPSNITNINQLAFYNCDNLTSIVVDSGNASYYSKGNCIVSTESGQIVLGCNNSTIPNDANITTIGSGAFVNCKNLTDLTIPSNITRILLYAFQHSDVVSVTIPNGVDEIQGLAFSFCENLEVITIPNGITTLGTQILYQCDKLKTINFGGTKEEWVAIQSRFLDEDFAGYTVYCSDGNIIK